MTFAQNPGQDDKAGGVKVVEKRCPSCGYQLAYFTGMTILRDKATDATADSEVRRHFQCADPNCRHQWRT